MPSKMLAGPQTVANIGDSGSASRHAGVAFTLSRSGKRKRPEIVIATDSSGVEVFDTRSQASRALTSCGVPPGEAFQCPPVSVIVKSTASRPQQRYTYWVTSSGKTSASQSVKLKNLKISCLHEDNKESKTLAKALGSNGLPASPVRCIQIVASGEPQDDSGRQSHSIIVVHTDGTVNWLSPDLSNTTFRGRLPDIQSPDESVAYATTLTVGEARHALLAQREDLTADIPADKGVVLAYILQHRSHSLRLSYFHLDPQPTALCSLPIPNPDDSGTVQRQFRLHARSAKLYNFCQRRPDSCLYIYDLSGLAVRQEAIISLPGATSFARVSQSTIAIGSDDLVALYDVKWKYLQGTISASSSASESSPVELLEHFGTSGAVVAVHGGLLRTFHLRNDFNVDGQTPKRRRTGGLADAVGQGRLEDVSSAKTNDAPLSTSSLGKRLVPASSKTAASEIKKRFDPLLTSSDIEEYDEAMLHALQTVSGNKRAASIGYAAQPDLIAYAACGLFDADPESEKDTGRLVVRIMAPETFRFLLTHGLLTVAHIEQSLVADGKLDREQRLPELAVVDALSRHDETLQALIYYLSSAPLLSANELSAALLACLKTVQRLASQQQMKPIENRASTIARMSNANKDGDVSISNESAESVDAVAGFEGDWPDPDPEEDLTHNARSALGSCLTRLSCYSDKDVKEAMRTAMSTGDILTLVDHIRMELSSGGWLARYLDDDLQGENDLSSQTNQVNVAAKILNCAIDSLGATTWLVGSGLDGEVSRSADKIAYMQAEINATLEGIENSAFLEHLLHEVLLYARTAEQAERQNTTSDIVPVPIGAEGKEAQMLPLGLKKATVERTKMAGGKKVSRSAREIGRLANKKVPQYSFERILI